MTDLYWPGDHRAGSLFTDSALLMALVSVESAWLAALVDAGVAPAAARADLTAVVSAGDAETIAVAAEADGNPVPGLLAVLRQRTGGEPARWLHRGLTSQDVIDTALMLCTRDTLSAVHREIVSQIGTLITLTERHQRDPMVARTLTQPALPSTVGMKIANWLSAVLDAADTVAALPPLPAQAGGAAGTLAATTELTGSPADAVSLSTRLAAALDLAYTGPWHTTRSVLTRIGDALVTCCDAWGHIAADIATGSRHEIGELAEGSGGGSSTMPHKSNPVLSILVRRAALAAPALAATLHTAAAASVDERSDGAWHTEWATMRTLARRTAVAAAHTTELLEGLRIDTDRAAANLRAAGDLRAEQRSMSELTGRPALSNYTGAADFLIDATLQRARQHLKEAI
ncbi:3-carboxy-cis,cis-muconate cycloisomerase [Mycobacterium sp. 3519A]|jgi:3-carboxy-cis,cis-muconate cycloisomerase|uniref:3-carboxy-cis,cis-muconate cycloisomerase n=1 Tax=Mycobacterium sp. 3519A TaxID=2057184 RepID=UPI000C7E3D58|nr:3-carboxy-cis,cis-muconate cycloisomerase [Mycobacterium sp. 3519A]